MKKTFRSIVTLLLVLAMLFGITSMTIAAATEGLSSAGTSGGGSSDPTIGGDVSTGWLEISYDANGVVVIIDPDVQSLLDMSKEDVKAVVQLVINAAKDLVINKLKDNILNGSISDEDEGAVEGVTKDNILTKTIDGYLQKNGYTGENSYFDFFKDVIEDDEDILITDFVDYACNLVRTAVSLGVVTLEELPSSSEIEQKITEQFNNKINEQTSAKITEYVNTYFEWITGDDISTPPALDDDVKALIDGQVKDYFKGLVNGYLDNNFAPAGEGKVQKLVADYLNKEIENYIADAISYYANGTLADGSVKDAINGKIDAWAQEIANTYPSVPASNILYSAVEGRVDSLLDDKIDKYIENYLVNVAIDSDVEAAIEAELKTQAPEKLYNKYWDLRETSGTKPTWYTKIDGAIKAKFEAECPGADYDALSKAQIIYAYPAFDNDALTEITPVVATFAKSDWIVAWKSLTDADKNTVIASVKAYDIITNKTGAIIDEYLEDGAKRQDVFFEVVNSVKYDALLDDIVAAAKSDANAKVAIKNEVEGLIAGEDIFTTIHDVLTDIKSDADKYKALKDEINEVISNKANEPDVLDLAYQTYFGLSKSEVDAKIAAYVDIFAEEYTYTVNDIKTNPPTLDIRELISYVTGIKVNGHSVFANLTINVDEIKALIKDVVPTPAEIQNMADDEMQRTLTFSIITDFGSVDFSVTAKLAGGFDKVRTAVALLGEFIDFDLSGNTVTLSVRVPAKVADYLLRACNTDRIPEELKHKVFAACSATPDDAYAILSGVTFDDLMKIFDYVDFDRILDSRFVERFERLDGLTEEQIKNKVSQYEEQFNKVIRFVKRIYNEKIPDNIKDNSIDTFYEGNGVFAYAGTHSVDIKELLIRVSPKYGLLISSYISDTHFTASVDLTLDFTNINSVEFVLDGRTVREGYLPVGADLGFFANVTVNEDGYRILKWVDENGDEYTTMPNKDVVLYAVADKAVVTVSGDVSDIYDEARTHELVATVAYEGMTENAAFTYKWFKIVNNVATEIAGATSDRITVSAVSDSGTYYCVVTIVDGQINDTVESNRVEVNIAKQTVKLSDVVSLDNTSVVFNGSEITVNAVIKPGYENIIRLFSISGNTGTNVGNYTVTATFEIIDEENYVFENSTATVNLDWEITPKTIALKDYSWSFDPEHPFVYNESEQSVVLDLPSYINTEGAYSDNSATNAFARENALTARIDVNVLRTNNPNYDFDTTDFVAECEWWIEKRVVNLKDDFAWNYTSPFTFSGSEFTVALTGLPADAQVQYGGTYSATNAGTYTATATVTLNSENYISTGTVAPLNWTVNPYNIVRGDIVLTSGLVYNRAPQTVSIVTLSNAPVAVRELFLSLAQISNNTATNAGTHYATVALSANGNLTYEGAATAEWNNIEWSIAKLSFDLSRLTWDYTSPIVYDEDHSNLAVYVNAGALGEIVLRYTGNTATAVGQFTATAVPADDAVNDNYDFGTTQVPALNWQVVPKTVDLGTLTWNYTGAYSYKGNEFRVFLVNSEGVEVQYASYTGNTATLAGTYNATAALTANGNYVYTGSFAPNLEWTIDKGIYDMSGITFNNLTVPYDGNSHTIVISGTLPAGVTVQYSGGNKTAVGTYTVTATFTGDYDNYEVIAPMTATLTITDSSTPVIPPVKNNEFNVIVDGNHVITVNAANGLPEGYKSTATNVTKNYTSALKDPAIFGNKKVGKVAVAYDIVFTDANGNPQEVQDNFTVEILIPEEYRNSENLKLVHIAEDGTLTEMEMTVKGDKAVFKTTHFSVYAIVEEQDAPSYWWIWLIIALLIIIIILLVVLIILNKRNKNTPVEEEAVVAEELPAEEETPEPEETTEEPAREEPAVEEPVD